MRYLGEQQISQFDSSGQIADILAFPDHLRDATLRVDTINLQLTDSSGGLIVAGMGGSAVGGLLSVGVFGDRATRRIAVVRDYALPPWATPDTTVLCASYSGNTEETLAAYDAARVLGAQRVVVTTGGALAAAARADGVPVIGLPAGLQPRASVAYMLVAVLEVAAACGCGPSLRAELDVAAAHLEKLIADWGPKSGSNSLAKHLAHAFYTKIPVIIGAGLTASVAYRWKTQLNENSKILALANELPEFDHNEIVAFENREYGRRCVVVFLEDADSHPRVRERVKLTCELIKANVDSTHRISTLGETSVERLLSLVLLGDLVSFYAAILAGMDPAPVQSIERLKAALG